MGRLWGGNWWSNYPGLPHKCSSFFSSSSFYSSFFSSFPHSAAAPLEQFTSKCCVSRTVHVKLFHSSVPSLGCTEAHYVVLSLGTGNLLLRAVCNEKHFSVGARRQNTGHGALLLHEHPLGSLRYPHMCAYAHSA